MISLDRNTQAYIGREQFDADEVAPSLCRRMAALLGLAPDLVVTGDPLPVGWAAMLFPDLPRPREIGSDGLPRVGAFLPPLPFSRRRFAGRAIELHRSLTIGAVVHRRTIIEAIEPKLGRAGKMTFLTLVHEISDGGELALTERQTMVFLDDPPKTEGPPRQAPQAPLPDPEWEQPFRPDPVLLFRYSAMTFNGHRIHYDLPYAQGSEGYPALVVNGGLTTLMLLEMARARLPQIANYRVRAVQPLFAEQPALLRGCPTSDGGLFWAVDATGALALRIDVWSSARA